MFTLQNDFLKTCFDGQGTLTHLENKQNGRGNVIARPEPLYRVIYQLGDNWENVAYAQDQRTAVTQDGNTLTIRVTGLRSKDAVIDASLALTARLDGQQLIFNAEVDNRSDALITDFFYPRVGAIKTLGEGKIDLVWPFQSGQRITNVLERLAVTGDTFDGRFKLDMSYPGPASMCWMSLADGGQSLYLGSHDEKHHLTVLRALGSEADDATLEVDKLAFVKPGEAWTCPPSVLMLYQGDWKPGADCYAAWARTWRTQAKQSDWVRNMTGYYLVINKQQFGDALWPYDTLPELYEYAKENGCDTLGLFGWYHTGHDNGYPDLAESEPMGGADALKAGIKAVQAAGGRVTLYYQGHLMDLGSKFYREKGHKLEGKSRWNTPYFEEYSKYHQSGYLRHFSKKLFATVCPSSVEWQDLMADKADWIASFGPDGMLYDQIGGMPAYPCFDESHHHMEDRPSLSYTQGRLKLLPRIRGQAKTHGDGFAFFSEHITDVYSQFLDAAHGIYSAPNGPKAAHAYAADADNRPSANLNYPELFRYCFPETIVTVRNPRPFLDPRMVNYAFLYGFRYEMELRYLEDQRDTREGRHAEWKAYAKRVADLRKKYADLLLTGLYRADSGFVNENPALAAALYEGETRRAIAVWNDTEEPQPVRVSGVTVRGYATPDGEGEGCPEVIAPGAVALLLL